MGHCLGGEESTHLSCSAHPFVALFSLLLSFFWIKGYLIGQRFGMAGMIHVIDPDSEDIVPCWYSATS